MKRFNNFFTGNVSVVLTSVTYPFHPSLFSLLVCFNIGNLYTEACLIHGQVIGLEPNGEVITRCVMGKLKHGLRLYVLPFTLLSRLLP